MTQLVLTPTQSPNNTAWIGIVQVIVAAICWGTLGIFSTYLNQYGFNGFQLTILRVVTAGILLLGMLPMLWPHLKKLNAKQWGELTIQSLVGVLGMSVFYFMAVVSLGAGPAVALLYTAPVFSLVFSAVLLQEHITQQAALLALLAVIGVGLTMLGEDAKINWGVGLGLMSGVCYSLYGVLGKRAMGESHAAPLVFFTSVCLSAVALLFFPTTYHTYQHLIPLPLNAWLYVLGLSLMGTLIPFYLYMQALKKLPATRASVFTTFEPLTALLLATVLLHQSLAAVQYLGVALILIASILNSQLKQVPRANA